MEGYGLILFLFIICLIIGISLISYGNNQTAILYNKSLNLTNAKCVLVCRYVNSNLDLKQDTPCYLLADDEKITIIPIEITDIQIPLYLTKITSFRHSFTGTNNSLAGSNLPGANNLIINYISDVDEIRQLTFSLILSNGEIHFNKYAISKCNLYKFVNERIPKQETTI